MPQQLDWLLEEPANTPEPKPKPEPVQPPAPRNQSTLAQWLLVAVLCGLAFLYFRDYKPGPGPTPDEDRIALDSDFALMLTDATKTMPAGQAAAANWSGVIAYAKEQDIALRLFDTSQDLTAVKPFDQLKAKADPAPSLTIVRGGFLTTGTIPGSVDELKNRLAKEN